MMSFAGRLTSRGLPLIARTGVGRGSRAPSACGRRFRMLGSGMGSLDLPHLEDLALEGSLCSPRYSSWLLQDRAVFPLLQSSSSIRGTPVFLTGKKKKGNPFIHPGSFPSPRMRLCALFGAALPREAQLAFFFNPCQQRLPSALLNRC